MIVVVPIVLVLVVLMFFGGIFWVTIGMVIHDGGKQRKLEADPWPIINSVFTGADQVVYRPGTRWGLSTPLMIEAANRKGYRFVSEQGTMATRQLVFAKV